MKINKEKFKTKLKNIGKDLWAILAWSSTVYFLFSLFIKKYEIQIQVNQIFLGIILGFIIGVIVFAIFDTILDLSKSFINKLAEYMADIKEIKKMKKDILELQKEIVELKQREVIK